LLKYWVDFVGQVKGYLKMVIGLFLILGAIGGHSESRELQEKHDTFCGEIMETFLDWDGNCEELRSHINAVEILSTILGGSSIFFLLSGRVEVKNSKKRR